MVPNKTVLKYSNLQSALIHNRLYLLSAKITYFFLIHLA